jgi:hypothetical protein
MTKELQETYVTRPKGKPETSMRGKMNEWSNGYREFIPQGTRENNRQMLKQLGDSSFYKTEGKKESSFSLHLNVDGKSEDPVAEMHEQFLLLTEGQRKEKPELTKGIAGRMLFDNGQTLQVWLYTEKSEVTILTRLTCSPQIDRQLLQAQSQMNVCLGRHREEIINSNNKK